MFFGSGCQRGKYCTYAHSEEEFGKKYIGDHREQAKTRKMVLCHFFEAGRPCHPGCAFAHGQGELGSLKTGSAHNKTVPSWLGEPGRAVTDKLENQFPRANEWRVVKIEAGWTTWHRWRRSADGAWEKETAVRNDRNEPVGGRPKPEQPRRFPAEKLKTVPEEPAASKPPRPPPVQSPGRGPVPEPKMGAEPVAQKTGAKLVAQAEPVAKPKAGAEPVAKPKAGPQPVAQAERVVVPPRWPVPAAGVPKTSGRIARAAAPVRPGETGKTLDEALFQRQTELRVAPGAK